MYADLQSLKAYLRIDDTDTVDDDELTMALQSASASIDHLCSRTFDTIADGEGEPSPTPRTFLPYWNRSYGMWVVPIDDLQAGTATAVNAWNPTDGDYTTALDLGSVFYGPQSTPEPYPYTEMALADGSGFAGVTRSPAPGWGWSGGPESYVQVTALWGWIAVPASVQQACLIQAARIFARRDAKFGIVNSLDGSSQSRLRASIDNDVAVLLRGYIKYWAAR